MNLQEGKRRFLEQADCLIIASDMPSAEINNAARFARLHSKPIIDLNTADCIFAVKRHDGAASAGMIIPGSRSVMLWGSPIELSKQAQLKSGRKI